MLRLLHYLRKWSPGGWSQAQSPGKFSCGIEYINSGTSFKGTGQRTRNGSSPVILKTCELGSPLWKGIWSAWLEVRPRIKKAIPTNKEESHRQSIFLNPFLSNSELTMWGDSGDTKAGALRRWSLEGITKLKHLWDPVWQSWIDTRDLFHLTRTQNLAIIRRDIIFSVPWSMSRQYPPKEGDWYTLNEPERALPEEFYQVRQVKDNGVLFVNVYRRVGTTERL